MIEVRKEVVSATSGQQVPWDHSALTGDFYFAPQLASAPAVGQVFSAVVVDLDERRGGATVQIADPAVLAHCDAPKGQLPLGGTIQVRLDAADVATRTVRFSRAP